MPTEPTQYLQCEKKRFSVTLTRIRLNHVGDAHSTLCCLFSIRLLDRAKLARISLVVQTNVKDFQWIVSGICHRITRHAPPSIGVVGITVHGVAVGKQNMATDPSLESQVPLDVRCQATDVSQELGTSYRNRQLPSFVVLLDMASL